MQHQIATPAHEAGRRKTMNYAPRQAPPPSLDHRPVAQPRLREALGLAHHHPLRRAGDLPRAAAHGGADAERHPVRGGHPHGAGGAALPAFRALRGRPRGPGPEAAGDHLGRPGTRPGARGRARVRLVRRALHAGALRRGLPRGPGLRHRVARLPGVHDRTRRAGEPRRGQREDRHLGLGRPARGPRARGRAHPVAHGALRDPAGRRVVLRLRLDAARHPAGGHGRPEALRGKRLARDRRGARRRLAQPHPARAGLVARGLADVPPRLRRRGDPVRRPRTGLLGRPRRRPVHAGGRGIARGRGRRRRPSTPATASARRCSSPWAAPAWPGW